VTRTALDEVFGGSGDFALSSGTVRMGLPHSKGGRRLYVVRPSAAGCTVTLPLAVFLPTPSSYVVVNLGTDPVNVIYAVLGTTLVTIPAGQQAELFLLNDSVPWGVWLSRLSTATVGTLLAERVAINLEFGAGAFGPVDLRRMAIDQGFTSEVAYAVNCTVRSGALIGSDSTSRAALSTGRWPTGSTLLLSIEAGAIVSGKGGAGGRGESVVGLLSENGSSGGYAIGVAANTTIVNRGMIQAGGGGGGGGGKSGTQAGGGGGGGAGSLRSLGGIGGSPNGPAGGDGTPTLFGVGGGFSLGVGGGNGGIPGSPGGAGVGGGLGGAAGYSIVRDSAFSYSYISTGGNLNGSVLVL
jgi:hypothetical protein